MRVLVTFAVDAEFAPWRKLRNFKKSPLLSVRRRPSPPLSEAKLDGAEVRVLLTGIGRNACEETMKQYELAGHGRPDLAISSGLAGALKENIKPSDVVAARRIRTLRNDANADADSFLLDRAVQSGAVPIQTLITAERIVQTSGEKRQLAFSGEAVDMESAFVMSKWIHEGVPCLTIRAISDAADEDLPIDFDRCLTPQGAVKPMNLVNAIVKRPGALASLLQFGRQSNQAAQGLAGFLDAFIVALSGVQCGG
jgi:adenosylhomocysteine nucleosidase